VRNNAVDIVQAILRHPKFPVTWKTGKGSVFITTAAGHTDGRLFELLLAEPRLFPVHNREELVKMMTLATINGPANIWMLTAQPSVMALPEELVRPVGGLVNHRDWFNQWKKIKEVRDTFLAEGRCFTWKDIPTEYRVRPDELEGGQHWLNTVVSVSVGEECVPWKGVCHHMVRTVRNSGNNTSKVDGARIGLHYRQWLKEGQLEHFGLLAADS
jgi:hypothetical protein